MHEIKHIIYEVPDNFEKDIDLKKVFAFAAKKRAQITFLYVLKNIPLEIKKIFKKHQRVDVEEMLVKEEIQKIENVLNKIDKNSIAYQVKVVIGDHYQLTLDELYSHKYDLLISTQFTTTGSLSEKLFGSRNMFLLRQSPCPVLIFRPKRKKKKYKMLIAIDVEDQTKKKKALNRKIIDYAFAASLYDEVDIHILQCWKLYGESSLRDGFLQVSEDELNKMLKETKAYFQKEFDSFLSYLPKSKHKVVTKLIKGEPTDIIPKYINKNNIDMLVIGTMSRSGLAGLTIGNIAEDILQSVDCSVMAIKPDNYSAR